MQAALKADPLFHLLLWLATENGKGYVRKRCTKSWRLPNRTGGPSAEFRRQMEVVGFEPPYSPQVSSYQHANLPCVMSTSSYGDPTLTLDLYAWERSALDLAERLHDVANGLECRLFRPGFLDDPDRIAAVIASSSAWCLAPLIREKAVGRVREPQGLAELVQKSTPSLVFVHAEWSGPSMCSLSILASWIRGLSLRERGLLDRLHVVDVEALAPVMPTLSRPVRMIGGNGELMQVGNDGMTLVAHSLQRPEEVDQAFRGLGEAPTGRGAQNGSSVHQG